MKGDRFTGLRIRESIATSEKTRRRPEKRKEAHLQKSVESIENHSSQCGSRHGETTMIIFFVGPPTYYTSPHTLNLSQQYPSCIYPDRSSMCVHARDILTLTIHNVSPRSYHAYMPANAPPPPARFITSMSACPQSRPARSTSRSHDHADASARHWNGKAGEGSEVICKSH